MHCLSEEGEGNNAQIDVHRAKQEDRGSHAVYLYVIRLKNEQDEGHDLRYILIGLASQVQLKLGTVDKIGPSSRRARSSSVATRG